MAKITYSSLGLKTNKDVNKVTFNGKEIEILKYLPTADKYSLINITIQDSKEGSIYCPVKLNALFHLYIVMMYTNISFTDKQKEDLLKLYDEINSNGLLELVITNMEEKEYDDLYNLLNQKEVDLLQYQNTVVAVIRDIIENLSVKQEELQEVINNFNPEQFKNVLDFVKAANSGNDVK